MQGLGFPSRLFDDATGTDYELYEEDGEFVLTVELPGFDREEIDLAWDGGILNIAAEHVDDDRSRKRTYHRRFRFPKDVDDEEITASYTNGILEVTLPVETDAAAHGTAIPIEG
jgi:HSP20 family protein